MEKFYLYETGVCQEILNKKDLSYYTYNDQNLNNNFNYTNLKSYYQINIPFVEHYQSEQCS